MFYVALVLKIVKPYCIRVLTANDVNEVDINFTATTLKHHIATINEEEYVYKELGQSRPLCNALI